MRQAEWEGVLIRMGSPDREHRTYVATNPANFHPGGLGSPLFVGEGHDRRRVGAIHRVSRVGSWQQDALIIAEGFLDVDAAEDAQPGFVQSWLVPDADGELTLLPAQPMVNGTVVCGTRRTPTTLVCDFELIGLTLGGEAPWPGSGLRMTKFVMDGVTV